MLSQFKETSVCHKYSPAWYSSPPNSLAGKYQVMTDSVQAHCKKVSWSRECLYTFINHTFSFILGFSLLLFTWRMRWEHYTDTNTYYKMQLISTDTMMSSLSLPSHSCVLRLIPWGESMRYWVSPQSCPFSPHPECSYMVDPFGGMGTWKHHLVYPLHAVAELLTLCLPLWPVAFFPSHGSLKGHSPHRCPRRAEPDPKTGPHASSSQMTSGKS